MIRNARVTSTMLGREDHGIFTFMIYIEFDNGNHSGFGGYALDEYDAKTETRIFKAKSMEVISKILKVVGADTWEDLPGKYIRFEDDGWGPMFTKIGNIMDDKWIDFDEFFYAKGEEND